MRGSVASQQSRHGHGHHQSYASGRRAPSNHTSVYHGGLAAPVSHHAAPCEAQSLPCVHSPCSSRVHRGAGLAGRPPHLPQRAGSPPASVSGAGASGASSGGSGGGAGGGKASDRPQRSTPPTTSASPAPSASSSGKGKGDKGDRGDRAESHAVEDGTHADGSSGRSGGNNPSSAAPVPTFQLSGIHIAIFGLIFAGGALFAAITLQFTAGGWHA